MKLFCEGKFGSFFRNLTAVDLRFILFRIADALNWPMVNLCLPPEPRTQIEHTKDVQSTSRASSKCRMYVQFTSCVQEVRVDNSFLRRLLTMKFSDFMLNYQMTTPLDYGQHGKL